MLCILRRRVLPQLPKTAKTFLHTTKVVYETRRIDGENDGDGGELVYFGIGKYLQRAINIRLHDDPTLELIFNIDELPLYKSSSLQFWPILCKIHFKPDLYEPLPVAIYAGMRKPPNVHHFMQDFVAEVNQLLENGNCDRRQVV